MPTYEYRREDGSVFQIRQKMSDNALTACPETGQAVERLISGGGGVIYKGSGFYLTDYKNASAPAANSSTSSDSAASSCSTGACPFA